MPSPPLKKLLRESLRGSWWQLGVGGWLALVVLAGCGAPVERPEPVQAPVLREPFLQSPTLGYDAAMPMDAAAALERAYTELMRGGSPGAALVLAGDYLDEPTTAAPASVLAAQAHFVAGDCAAALARLEEPILARPSYVAAQLLAGRCAEMQGDLAAAAASFHAIEDLDRLAQARLETIRFPARDAAIGAVREAVARGELATASERLAQLQSWAPQDVETLAAVSELAAALDDEALELKLVRDLVARGERRPALRERQADLEMAVGDAGRGLRLLEELNREMPSDVRLAEKLERARFEWRLTMLPGAARDLDTAIELDRGQLAVLMYWVFPSVRYQRAEEAIIANDILDHENRAEIVRVVNLGLMQIDPNLHAFRPDATARRGNVLASYLRVLAGSPAAGSCLGGASPASALSDDSICGLAAACGLIDEPADCLPEAPVSGTVAMEWASRASRRLEHE